MSKPHIRIHSAFTLPVLPCNKCHFGKGRGCGADQLLHRELRCWQEGGYWFELISGDLPKAPNGNL